MPKEKDKSQKLKVRVNSTPEGEPPDRDEVFILSADPKADPFVNRGIYVKPGLFKDGSEMTSEQVDELESRSKKILAEEQSAKEKVAQERATREQEAAANEEASAPALEG